MKNTLHFKRINAMVVYGALVLPSPSEIDQYISSRYVCCESTGRIASSLIDLYRDMQPTSISVIDLNGSVLGTVTTTSATSANEDEWRPILVLGGVVDYNVHGLEFVLDGMDVAHVTITRDDSLSGTNHQVTVVGTDVQITIDESLVGSLLDIVGAIADDLTGLLSVSATSTGSLPLANGESVSFTLDRCRVGLTWRALYNGNIQYAAVSSLGTLTGIANYTSLLLQLFGSEFISPIELDAVLAGSAYTPSSFTFITRNTDASCHGTFNVSVPAILSDLSCTSAYSRLVNGMNTARAIMAGQYTRYSDNDITAPDYVSLVSGVNSLFASISIQTDEFVSVVTDAMVSCALNRLASCPLTGNGYAVHAAWQGLIQVVQSYDFVAWFDSVRASLRYYGAACGNWKQIRAVFLTAFVQAGLPIESRDNYNYYVDLVVRGISNACCVGAKSRLRPRCC